MWRRKVASTGGLFFIDHFQEVEKRQPTQCSKNTSSFSFLFALFVQCGELGAQGTILSKVSLCGEHSSKNLYEWYSQISLLKMALPFCNYSMTTCKRGSNCAVLVVGYFCKWCVQFALITEHHRCIAHNRLLSCYGCCYFCFKPSTSELSRWPVSKYSAWLVCCSAASKVVCKGTSILFPSGWDDFGYYLCATRVIVGKVAFMRSNGARIGSAVRWWVSSKPACIQCGVLHLSIHFIQARAWVVRGMACHLIFLC